MAVRVVFSNDATFHLRGKINYLNYLISSSQILTNSSKMTGALFVQCDVATFMVFLY